MAKQSGLGDNLYIGGNDVSGDISSLASISGSQKTIEVTAINVSAFERLGGERDGGIDFTAYFNPTRVHPVLSALPSADALLTYCRGTLLGSPAACMLAKQLNYDGSLGTAGDFTFKVSAKANAFGLEWGVQGTAGWRTDAAATNGTAIDLGAAWSASFGLQSYLQVNALTSGTPTVKLQHSNDNGSTDPFADITGGGFGVITALSGQRIATANNLAIKRYIRVASTGTFAGLVYSVVVVPNITAVSF